MNQNGLTLIELLAVIVIISILSLIAIPAVRALIEQAESRVCDENLQQLKDDYDMHLSTSGVTHSDVLFQMYVVEWNKGYCICRDDSVPYVQPDGEIMCNNAEEEEEGVPILWSKIISVRTDVILTIKI